MLATKRAPAFHTANSCLCLSYGDVINTKYLVRMQQPPCFTHGGCVALFGPADTIKGVEFLLSTYSEEHSVNVWIGSTYPDSACVSFVICNSLYHRVVYLQACGCAYQVTSLLGEITKLYSLTVQVCLYSCTYVSVFACVLWSLWWAATPLLHLNCSLSHKKQQLDSKVRFD